MYCINASTVLSVCSLKIYFDLPHYVPTVVPPSPMRRDSSPPQRSGSRAARGAVHSSRQSVLLLTDGSSVPLRGTATAMTRNSNQRTVTDDNAHKVGFGQQQQQQHELEMSPRA